MQSVVAPPRMSVDFSRFDANRPQLAFGKVERRLKLEERDPSLLLLPHVPREDKVRFVCISDTHNQHSKIAHSPLPEGDVLLHTGDFSGAGLVVEVERFNEWLGTLPYQHKIVIAGNHDKSLDKRSRNSVDGHSVLTNCTYLEDESCEVFGYKVFGSPWVPTFGFWAFMKEREELKDTWQSVPHDTDILLTHGPPLGILDLCSSGHLSGCMYLLESIINRLPSLSHHVFGHIHEAYGVCYSPALNTHFLNTSTCNFCYAPNNPPVVFELRKRPLVVV